MSNNDSYTPDFVVGSISDDTQQDAVEDIADWWEDLGEEQKCDYLSAWDGLRYGDTTWVGDYRVVCVQPALVEGYAMFEICLH